MKIVGFTLAVLLLVCTPVLAEGSNMYVEVKPGLHLRGTCETLAREGRLEENLTADGCLNAVYYYLYGDTTARAEHLAKLLLPGITLPFPVKGVDYPHPPNEKLGAYYASPHPVFVGGEEGRFKKHARTARSVKKIVHHRLRHRTTAPKKQTIQTPAPQPRGGLETRLDGIAASIAAQTEETRSGLNRVEAVLNTLNDPFLGTAQALEISEKTNPTPLSWFLLIASILLILGLAVQQFRLTNQIRIVERDCVGHVRNFVIPNSRLTVEVPERDRTIHLQAVKSLLTEDGPVTYYRMPCGTEVMWRNALNHLRCPNCRSHLSEKGVVLT
jgi:hypothetical protein